jgi:hypothetical protein
MQPAPSRTCPPSSARSCSVPDSVVARATIASDSNFGVFIRISIRQVHLRQEQRGSQPSAHRRPAPQPWRRAHRYGAFLLSTKFLSEFNFALIRSVFAELTPPHGRHAWPDEKGSSRDDDSGDGAEQRVDQYIGRNFRIVCLSFRRVRLARILHPDCIPRSVSGTSSHSTKNTIAADGSWISSHGCGWTTPWMLQWPRPTYRRAVSRFPSVISTSPGGDSRPIPAVPLRLSRAPARSANQHPHRASSHPRPGV